MREGQRYSNVFVFWLTLTRGESDLETGGEGRVGHPGIEKTDSMLRNHTCAEFGIVRSERSSSIGNGSSISRTGSHFAESRIALIVVFFESIQRLGNISRIEVAAVDSLESKCL
jgi:hypothetical protein